MTTVNIAERTRILLRSSVLNIDSFWQQNIEEMICNNEAVLALEFISDWIVEKDLQISSNILDELEFLLGHFNSNRNIDYIRSNSLVTKCDNSN